MQTDPIRVPKLAIVLIADGYVSTFHFVEVVVIHLTSFNPSVRPTRNNPSIR
jgi:hypothetical protein